MSVFFLANFEDGLGLVKDRNDTVFRHLRGRACFLFAGWDDDEVLVPINMVPSQFPKLAGSESGVAKDVKDVPHKLRVVFLAHHAPVGDAPITRLEERLELDFRDNALAPPLRQERQLSPGGLDESVCVDRVV